MISHHLQIRKKVLFVVWYWQSYGSYLILILWKMPTDDWCKLSWWKCKRNCCWYVSLVMTPITSKQNCSSCITLYIPNEFFPFIGISFSLKVFIAQTKFHRMSAYGSRIHNVLSKHFWKRKITPVWLDAQPYYNDKFIREFQLI